MRYLAILIAVSLVAGAAYADAWQEYRYPDYAFAVMFPAAPRAEATTYQPVDGRSVPARMWSVDMGKSQFKVTVADIANGGLQETAIIDHAMKALSAGGEVRVDYPHRISQVYGRQFSIVNRDGSRETAAVFDYKNRVYQIEAKLLPGGDDTDMIRFQQSLIFTDGGTNRPPELRNALREACRGIVNNPAGPDDPRCQRK
jgi:hypothetical protein